MENRKETLKITYELECERQCSRYEQWISKNEASLEESKAPECCILFCEELLTDIEETIRIVENGNSTTDFVILTARSGKLASFAVNEFQKAFAKQTALTFLYADEDELTENGRENPWFKPEWSPDTLRSFFYFGHIMAIKKDILLSELREITAENKESYQNFVRRIVEKNVIKIGHVDSILFHGTGNKEKDEIKNIILHVEKRDSIEEKVSIIIPSKDHPEILENCIRSIREKTTYRNYEIVVVDNGSNEENRQKIKQLEKQLDFIYQYEESVFNFSRMCNKGARMSWGKVLLFLNDDIEIISPDWMTKLAGQALLSHAGAVGAKLYYPDGKRIQHVGITNMGVGPAHKLAGVIDEGSIYHARNLANYNVIAVTGACLAVDKRKFEAVGGFSEDLPIAYNDVDFCFSLWEKGWYNVVRNDVTLYHHESISRGSDESKEKRERLLSERRKLYERHPGLYRKDPFYSRHLVQDRLDTMYSVEYKFDYENEKMFSANEEIPCPKVNARGILRRLLRRGPLALGHVDRVEEKYSEFLKKEGAFTEIEGWCGCTTQPNERKERVLLLKDASSQCYTVSVFDKYRTDTKAVFPNQIHYELSGFVARIEKGRIPSGTYEVGVQFTDLISGKKIVCDLDCTISI